MNHRSRLVTVVTALLATASLGVPAARAAADGGTASAAPPPASAPGSAAVPPGFIPSSTSWTSTDDGWVLGFRPCSRGTRQRCGTLAHTTDGGATWTNATVPAGIRVSPRFRPVQIAFAPATAAGDPDTGLVSDGTRLFMTSDGAESWQAASLGAAPSIGDIGLSRTAAYAMVGTGSLETGTTALYATPRDHGHWAPVPKVHTAGNGVNIDGGYDLAISGDHGAVALGRIFVDTGYWHTDDGTTWSRQPAPCTSEQVPSVNWVGPHKTVVTCSYNPGMSHQYKDVRLSVDGGAFTTTSSAPDDLFTTATGAVTAVRPLIGATGAGVSWLYATFDGGTSWKIVLEVDDELPFHDIQFTDARHGYLVLGGSAFDRGAAYVTDDGGRSWQVLKIG